MRVSAMAIWIYISMKTGSLPPPIWYRSGVMDVAVPIRNVPYSSVIDPMIKLALTAV